MVMIRKPVQRSENLVDRRDMPRRGYESVDAYMRKMQAKHEALARMQAEWLRRLRQQQTRGR